MAKKSKKRTVQQRRITVIVTVVVAAIVIMGTVILLAVAQTRQQQGGEEKPTREEELQSVSTDADQAIGEGNLDEGVRIYDQAIDEAQDDPEKAQLLADKATAYFNAEQYDQALETALEADKVDSTSSINAFIAQIYEIKKDNGKAAQYYRLAAQKVDKKNNPMWEQDQNYYAARADELEGN